MTQTGPWSVKGIDQRARELAREAAREEGLTLGEYINRLILDGHHEGAKAAIRSRLKIDEDRSRKDGDQIEDTKSVLESLARRIETSEARSTLAITGIDQSVLGLISRLEDAEHSQHAMGADLSRSIEDIKSTHRALQNKVAQLEQDDAPSRNLEALKALEVALGRLASHVYEENEVVRSRMETLEGGVDGMEAAVDAKLSAAAETIRETELRLEGANRHLSDRFSGLEASMAEHLKAFQTPSPEQTARFDNIDSTLDGLQKRLSEAEHTTDLALKTLEANFKTLDARLEHLAIKSQDAENNGESAEQSRLRFEQLSREMRMSIGDARAEFASRIESLQLPQDPEYLEKRFGEISAQISEIEDRAETAVQEAVGGVEERLTGLIAEKMPEFELGRLSDDLQRRIDESEKRNASAIEQVGQQVATAAQRLKLHQAESIKALNEKIDEGRRRDRERLSEALGTVADQLETAEQRSAEQMSPMQRAIASLAKRIEAMEDFAAPPFSKAPADKNVALPAATNFAAEISKSLPEPETVQEEGIDDSLLWDNEEPIEDQADDLGSDFSLLIEDSLQAELPADESELELSDSDLTLAEETPDLSNAVWSDIADEALDFDELPPFDDADFSDDTSESETLEVEPPVDPVEDEGDALADDLESTSDLEAEDVGDATPSSFDVDALASMQQLSREWAEDSAVDISYDIDDASAEPKTEPVLADPTGWGETDFDDGRYEPRESDVYDNDSAFEDAAHRDPEFALTDGEPLSDEEGTGDYFEDLSDLPELDEPEAEPTDADSSEANVIAENAPKADLEDYIARARRAAIEASSPDAGRPASFNSTKSRKQLMLGAAAAAVLLVAAGTACFLFFSSGDEPQIPPPADNSEPAQTETVATDIDSPVFGEPSGAEVDATVEGTSFVSEGEAITVPIETDGEAVEIGSDAEFAPDEIVTTPVVSDAPEAETATEPVPVTPEYFVPSEPIPRIQTLESAARAGDRAAAFTLGERLIEQGDVNGGVELVQQAAAAGQPAAQYRLGQLHESGLGVTRDPAEALVWFERAAKGGNVKAMLTVGLYYSDPNAEWFNHAEAAAWFRRGAEYGTVNSQFNLAIMYEQGLGVTENKSEAYFWASVAAQSGDADAQQFANEIKDVLPPAQVPAVDQRVSDWRSATPNSAANGIFANQNFGKVSAQQVMAIQETLRGLGYDVTVIDGQSGPRTLAAINAFRRDEGLTVSGNIDNDLIIALNRAAAPLR